LKFLGTNKLGNVITLRDIVTCEF